METISSSDSCPWKESLDPKQMLVSIQQQQQQQQQQQH